MWHTDYDGGDEEKQRKFSFAENKIGAPVLEKEPPFNFDKKEYKALVVKLLDEFQKL